MSARSVSIRSPSGLTRYECRPSTPNNGWIAVRKYERDDPRREEWAFVNRTYMARPYANAMVKKMLAAGWTRDP